MGFFDKMFEKKECAICGTELGLLGKTKINEGYLCKECAGKLSPFFRGHRSSTADDIREQLAYREANAQRLASFNPTRTLSAGRTNIMLDEDAKLLIVTAAARWRDANPDIDRVHPGTGLRYRDRGASHRAVSRKQGWRARELQSPALRPRLRLPCHDPCQHAILHRDQPARQ